MPPSIRDTTKIDPTRLHAYSTGLLQGVAYSRLHTHLTTTLVPFGISIPEWKLLGQLHDHGAMRLAKLAELLDYDPPMVTKLATQLEGKKLTVRSPDPIDDRAKVITLTSGGRDLVESIEPAVKKTMALILRGVSHEDILTYIGVLTAIVDNTEAQYLESVGYTQDGHCEEPPHMRQSLPRTAIRGGNPMDL